MSGPKYGALNLLNHPDGAAPRFGSCHVRLRPELNERCTFTVGDSHLGPADVGTHLMFENVLAGLLERRMSDVDAISRMPLLASATPGRVMDDYVEAQVHGGVDLARHAEAIVLDPSFRGTASGDLLQDLALRCGIALEWHAGFRLWARDVPAELKGPGIPPCALEVAGHEGMLDAAVIGRAAATIVREPESWRRWGTQDEVLQYVKYLWHVLVYMG